MKFGRGDAEMGQSPSLNRDVRRAPLCLEMMSGFES